MPTWERRFKFCPFALDVNDSQGTSAKHVVRQIAKFHSKARSMTSAPYKRLALQTISITVQSTNARKILSRRPSFPPEELVPNFLCTTG
jgi:hypothetical protein